MRTDRLLLVLGLLTWASAARAHQAASERAAVVQVDEQGVAVMLTVTLRGPQADLLVALHDRERDGLDEAEAKAVASALVTKAARDLIVSIDGEASAASNIEAKLHESPAGVSVLQASGLLTVDRIPRSRLSIEAKAARAPLRVDARALGALRLTSTDRGRLDADGRALTTPVVLTPPSAVAFGIGRR